MGLLICNKCNARYEADTFAEAIDKIDHSIGCWNGRICPNDGTNHMEWNGITVPKDRSEPKVYHNTDTKPYVEPVTLTESKESPKAKKKK